MPSTSQSPRSAPIAPEWVTPGTKVLVVQGYPNEKQSIAKKTIDKVYKRYFTVTDSDLRFSLNHQGHQPADVWTSPTRVFPLDSDEAKKILEAARRRRLVKTAENAFAEWQRRPSPSTRLTAIEALQAVEDGGSSDA